MYVCSWVYRRKKKKEEKRINDHIIICVCVKMTMVWDLIHARLTYRKRERIEGLRYQVIHFTCWPDGGFRAKKSC